jgi:hypothetical protein
MKILTFDDEGPIQRAFWDPRTNQIEETSNLALQLLDQLMDSPTLDIEAIKRVAGISDQERMGHGH